jgi:alpha-2-macroglobulin
MGSSPTARRRSRRSLHSLRSPASLGAACLLAAGAGCFHLTPPAVAPSATLSPPDGRGAGPRTQGPFAVVFAAPREQVEARGEATVTVLFNRPMRSLEMPPDQGLPAITVQASDGHAVAGSWRWIGTRGALFTPDGVLPAANEFTVTVPKGARAEDGSELAADYSFSFTTARPELVRSSPAAGAKIVKPDESFVLVFNQSVSPAEVEKAASLRVRRGDGDEGERIALHASIAPALHDEAKRGQHRVILRADKPLPLDRDIDLTIAAGLRGADGPLPMKAPVTLSMRTYGPLRLVDFYCPRAEHNGRCRAHNDVRVHLSTPVDPAEFKRHVRAPDLPDYKAPSGKGGKAAAVARAIRKLQTGEEQWLGADPAAGKRYRVTLTKGMRDVFGQVLEKDMPFDLETEAPFVRARASKRRAPPPAGDSSDGPVDDGGRAQRARLRYELEMGLVGQVLEAKASGGVKSHKVPVESVNIPTYSLTSGAVGEGQLLTWLGGKRDDFALRNGLVPRWVTPGVPENTRAVSPLDLDTLLASSAGRGVAYVELDVPGTGSATRRLVTVTDLAVTSKLSRYGSMIWVTQLSTGKPVAGAKVAVRAAIKGELAATTTNDEGLAFILKEQWDPLDDKARKLAGTPVLFVKSGDDWAYHTLERSVADQRAAGSFQDLTTLADWAGLLFTDRGVYRPGETLKLSGLFRRVDPASMSSVAGKDVRLTLRDASGAQIFSGRASTDEFGAFSLDAAIPKTAKLGDAQLSAVVKDRGRTAEASADIKLLTYKASEFKVAADADRRAYVKGDRAAFTVKGDYLYGAPMEGAPVHAVVTRSIASFTPPGAEGFVTTDRAGLARASRLRTTELGAVDKELDAEGKLVHSVALDMPGQITPEQVMLEAEVEDISRQTVAGRVSTLVHPAEFYLGLKAAGERFVNAGSTLAPEVVALEPSGERRAGAAVKLELWSRTWTAAVEEQGDGTPHRTSTMKDTLVASCDVTTAATARTCPLRVPDVGLYVVRAVSKDPRGNEVMASSTLYGVDGQPREDKPVAWAHSDARTVVLEQSQERYEIGQTAKIMVRSPFKEATALVTVERDGVLFRKTMQLSGPMPVVTVPIEPGYYPNAYVSVHLVRGRVQAPPEKGADLGGPEFRVGYASLAVNPEAHRLKVELSPSKTELRPGDELDTDVTLTDREGKPAQGELTFYAVDEGVLMLTGYTTPDPLPAFSVRRSLALYTAESREWLGHIIPMKAGEHVPTLGVELEAKPDDDKGRNGGDGGGGGLLRADFRTTAFFEAGRVTTTEGKARFHFKLPDNLTTFRLMAVAAGKSDHFGFGEATVTTSRKVMARPALPRIVRVGDAFEASVAVSSKPPASTGKSAVLGAAAEPGGQREVDVSFSARGLAVAGETQRRVTLPQGGSVEVRFPVTATQAGEATFEFGVAVPGAGADETDRVRVKRTIVLPTSPATAAVYGETTEAASVMLGDMKGVSPDQGGLEVRVASTALVGLSTSLERLIDYPYGCTEQLASRSLPLLSLSELARDYKVRLPANTAGSLEDASSKILRNQRGDGGFGYWEDSASSEPWLSAYVTMTLEAARKQGVFIPAEAMDQAVSYLRNVLSSARIDDDDAGRPDTIEEADEPGAPEPGQGATLTPAQRVARSREERLLLDFAQAAFISDVLATIGSPDPGYLNRLFDARKGKPLFARALLLHAMAKSSMARQQLESFAKELIGDLRVGASEAVAGEAGGSLYTGMLDSPARTTALALRALLAVDHDEPLAPRLARGLLGMRENGAWRSTQENAWALMALNDYRQAQEQGAEAFDARVFWGNDVVAQASFKPGADREDRKSFPASSLLERPGQALTFQVVGSGRVFYAAELRVADTRLPTRSEDRGLFVQKLTRALGPEELADASEWIPKQSTDSAVAGQLVLVDLLVESAEARKQVVIDDPLPAGLEAINADLETASRSRTVQDDQGGKRGRRDQPARPGELTGLGASFQSAAVHREVHDDKVLTFIEDLQPGMYHFRYLARATSIGTFVVPPTQVACMYSPEIAGRTAASRFEVKPKK